MHCIDSENCCSAMHTHSLGLSSPIATSTVKLYRYFLALNDNGQSGPVDH